MKILIAIYLVVVNMAFDMSVLSKFGNKATQQEIVSNDNFLYRFQSDVSIIIYEKTYKHSARSS